MVLHGVASNHYCGGVILTELFAISTAYCMLENAPNIIYESRAGEHDLTQIEGHEQL